MIVIADNYVELLDHGVSREDAAWRSATEMAVPVLRSYMLTIIASFLPLVTLSGSLWPVHSWSPPRRDNRIWLVRLPSQCFFTPLLCRFFYQEGLCIAGDEAAGRKKKFDILDFMQAAYNRAIAFLMGRKWIAVGAGIVCSVCIGRLVVQDCSPAVLSVGGTESVCGSMYGCPRLHASNRLTAMIQRIETFLKKKNCC